MADEAQGNLNRMYRLDFEGWNGQDWEFMSEHHTDDVYVSINGTVTKGLDVHMEAIKASAAASPDRKITSHPIAFGSGDWTCVVSDVTGGGQIVTVARWADGQITEEHIWM
jgi:hypothetical protein